MTSLALAASIVIAALILAAMVISAWGRFR
jgi:hypothetical protein